ncbi:TPA: hypothetical protein ACGUU3_004214 [Vibrio vulnificus]
MGFCAYFSCFFIIVVSLSVNASDDVEPLVAYASSDSWSVSSQSNNIIYGPKRKVKVYENDLSVVPVAFVSNYKPKFGLLIKSETPIESCRAIIVEYFPQDEVLVLAGNKIVMESKCGSDSKSIIMTPKSELGHNIFLTEIDLNHKIKVTHFYSGASIDISGTGFSNLFKPLISWSRLLEGSV